MAVLREPRGLREQRHLGRLQCHGEVRAARHFQRVAEQAEAGDVGDGMYGIVAGQFAADAVELRGRGQHLGIALAGQFAFLDRRGIYADPDRLGQDQGIAGPGAGVAAHLAGATETDHRKAVDRLRCVDRMAARHRNAGGGADAGAARDDLAHVLDRDLVQRHAEDRQRHDRPGAHGVDVGEGIGRRDPAEVERIVDDRHEEIGGGDDACVVVDLPHRGVVAGLDPDQKLAERRRGRLVGEQLLQHRGRELAAAAAAMGKAGQARKRGIHCSISSGMRRAAAASTGIPRAARSGERQTVMRDHKPDRAGDANTPAQARWSPVPIESKRGSISLFQSVFLVRTGPASLENAIASGRSGAS